MKLQGRRGGLGARVIRSFARVLAGLALMLSGVGTALAQECVGGAVVRPLIGYNANITTSPAIASVRRGQLVEFNPRSLKDPVPYMREIARRGAVPEWYWGGGNCNKDWDCAPLQAAKVPLGSTGTAEWNVGEFRIYDLTHVAVIARAEKMMERALQAAAAAQSDLVFRIDNLHDLDDTRFYDTKHVRSHEEVRAMTETWSRVEGRLRAAGHLRPNQMTGLTAHNNFAFWKRYMAEGGRPPVVLRLENPTQFPQELEHANEIMRTRQIPLIGVEFEKGHLYNPTPEGLKSVAAKVSLMVVMKNEDNYEAGRHVEGPGPKVMTTTANQGACR